MISGLFQCNFSQIIHSSHAGEIGHDRKIFHSRNSSPGSEIGPTPTQASPHQQNSPVLMAGITRWMWRFGYRSGENWVANVQHKRLFEWFLVIHWLFRLLLWRRKKRRQGETPLELCIHKSSIYFNWIVSWRKARSHDCPRFIRLSKLDEYLICTHSIQNPPVTNKLEEVKDFECSWPVVRSNSRETRWWTKHTAICRWINMSVTVLGGRGSYNTPKHRIALTWKKQLSVAASALCE